MNFLNALILHVTCFFLSFPLCHDALSSLRTSRFLRLPQKFRLSEYEYIEVPVPKINFEYTIMIFLMFFNKKETRAAKSMWC